MDKKQQYARRYRVCFRTTRSVSAQISDLAHDFGFNRSQMVHWLVLRALELVMPERTWQARAAEIAYGLTGEERDRFYAEVEKGLHNPHPDGIPF